MDKQKLHTLLQKQEGTKLDFKAMLSLKTESEKKELGKDVAAIANSKGGRGYIIYGIEDGTKTILGIEGKSYTEEQIQQIISQRCDPPVSVKLETIAIDDKQIAVLTIYRSSQKPHQIRQTGVFYIRRGSTTDIARREEIASMLQESGMLQHERIVLNRVELKELDKEIVNDYISRTGFTSTNEDYYTLLEGVGIIGRDEDNDGYHPTVGGLLVFGYHPQLYLPHTGIRLIDKFSANEVIYFSGPITKMLDEIENYLRLKITNINGEYPVAAVVEAIANAAVHRDYFSLGREIVVLIENKKIEISNPGATCSDEDMPGLVEEYNPYRRNQWLYQRLLILDNKRRFLKTGTGMKRIYDAFKQHGGVKFINNEKRNLFKVVLPGIMKY
ncbi:MAG: putative DNA binding domain-containing protein [Clostridiaceae bacterium]|nr:putative DNA binding domain-containing protein [Clostridiaceae bacterium]